MSFKKRMGRGHSRPASDLQGGSTEAPEGGPAGGSQDQRDSSLGLTIQIENK